MAVGVVVGAGERFRVWVSRLGLQPLADDAGALLAVCSPSAAVSVAVSVAVAVFG
jgi:hypothetical protein